MLKYVLAFLFLTVAAQAAPSFGDLKPAQVIEGFRTEAVYLNGADRPIGARFVHQRTGFTFDCLQVESVPQAFVWVNTAPTSDNGEPHTQEHLLLGKGNQGRGVANLEALSLTETGAFTMQWRTCYHFNTRAGPDTFYRFLERQLDALLRPNYSDEEVRREVRNFGVTADPKTKQLHLAEQGTVYNEMVSTYQQPDVWSWRAVWQAVYGTTHPLYLESGGTPAGLRQLTPQAIRQFHDAHYVLSNMGMVGALPRRMTLTSVLTRVDALLNRLQPGAVPKVTRKGFPPPHAAPTGQVLLVDYPDRNDQQPESLIMAWPAVRNLSTRDELLLTLFCDNLCSDATTNLYKVFVDTRTRQIDTGATAVWDFVGSDQGHPVMLGLNGVPSSRLTPALLRDVRQKVRDELARVAAWPDGSPELADFNRRLQSRIVERQRALSKFIGTPPEFGFRSTGSDWMDHLLKLERSGQFTRSLTLKPELAYISTLTASQHNAWRDLLSQWHLSDTEPYAIAPHASPSLVSRDVKDKDERLHRELVRLEQKYQTQDAQTALHRYKTDYDVTSAQLERIAQSVPYPTFVQNPPMTLDDDLQYRMGSAGRDIPMVTSTFDDLSGTTVGLALRLDGVAPEQLPLLVLLPELLTDVGVIDHGQPIGYETMQDRLRNEILSLYAGFSANGRTGRTELLLTGAGNSLTESQQALAWMVRVLQAPDWRPENLPRLRDVVDQRLNELRNVRENAEETWVSSVATAWRHQHDATFLATTCFLTQMHLAQRLRWRLKDVPDRPALVAYLNELAGVTAGRDELKQLLGALKGESHTAGSLQKYVHDLPGVKDVATDLDAVLSDVPDGSLSRDWADQCHEMAADVAFGPDKTLAALNELRQSLLRTGRARVFMTGPKAQEDALQTPLHDLVAILQQGPNPVDEDFKRIPQVTARLKQREPDADPLYVGLVNPNSQGGVFLNSAPGTYYDQTDEQSLLNALAFEVYGGHGSHSMYMKTWAAGLAYSNGLRDSLGRGLFNYYAERCPELSQTLTFVVGQLKRATVSPSLAEYAVAQTFPTRSAQTYESRGEAMAADLADGLTGDVVRRFHQAVLAVRRKPDLARQLFARLAAVDGTVLPGLGGDPATVKGGVYFVIGADKQFDLYQGYLQTVEGPGAHLYRLYPRDFWVDGPTGQSL